ncbi:MAG: tetratricopeptide repeat protein [Acidobacteriota bacterium]|nr:tetratricopeptide repeat protein [Acidobacteriota bacterium]
MYRLLLGALFASCAMAQCRLPDVAPDALDRLSPAGLVDAGHFLRAEKQLDSLVKANPQDGQAAWLLSRAKAALGEMDEALSLAESAVGADPDNAAYHVQVAAVAGRIAEKANLLKQLTFAKKARQELDAATKIDSGNIEAQYGLMLFYFAAPALVGGDKNKAARIGEQIAATSPARGRFYQARLAVQMKDYAKAESYLRQSAIEDPLLFDTDAALAKLYIDLKPDRTKAEIWACQAVHADPTRADAWALMARVYTMCGCWTEALDMARRAGVVDGENQSAAYAIADVAVERGEQLALAVDLLRKYLNQPAEGDQPTPAMAHARLGAALAKLGKTDEANAEFAAAKLDPKAPAAN